MYKKHLFLIILIITFLFISVGIILYFQFTKNPPPIANKNANAVNASVACGGVENTSCPSGYFCKFFVNTNSSPREGTCASSSEPVEYDESFGVVCPLGVKFLGAKDAPNIECACPEGYEFDSEIIGYNQCYGEGSECPIMSSECIQK